LFIGDFCACSCCYGSLWQQWFAANWSLLNIEDLPTLLSLLYPGETQSTLVFFSMIFVLLIPIISLIVCWNKKYFFNYKKFVQNNCNFINYFMVICAGILVITGIDLGHEYAQ